MKLRHLAFAALLPLAACNNNPTNPFAGTVPTPMPGVPTTTSFDQKFMQQAAQSDMFEIQSSQLALTKARSPAVRKFASNMIDEHTRTTQQLTDMASRKAVLLPAELDPVLQQKMAVLQATNRTFDRAYMANQVAGHRDAVQNLNSEISGGTDPEVKAFAQQTLPIVQGHLDMARAIRAR